MLRKCLYPATLLNAVAGRLNNLTITSGSVNFVPYEPTSPLGPSSPPPSPRSAHHSRRSKAAKNSIGYVRQEDVLLPYLTVRETLHFAAALRLPASVSSEQKDLIVEQTIAELGLKDAADTLVGGAFRKGISGGEKRRLVFRLSCAYMMVALGD